LTPNITAVDQNGFIPIIDTPWRRLPKDQRREAGFKQRRIALKDFSDINFP